MMTELVCDLVINITTNCTHICKTSRLQGANTNFTIGTEKARMTILKFTIGALFALFPR